MHPTPSFTRAVAALSAPNSAIDSGRGFAMTLSPTQIESNSAMRSTSRAIETICGHVAIPKNTPRCGRVNPKLTRPAMLRLALFDGQSRADQPRGIEPGTFRPDSVAAYGDCP